MKCFFFKYKISTIPLLKIATLLKTDDSTVLLYLYFKDLTVAYR